MPPAGGTITGGGSYRYGETATLTATPAEGYDFISWLENGLILSHQREITFTVTGNRSLYVHFLLLTALPDPPVTEDFKVYPNPTSGTLYIQSNLQDNSAYRVEVFTSTGMLVLQKKLVPDGMEELNLEHLAKGICIVIIRGENRYHAEKIIIQ